MQDAGMEVQKNYGGINERKGNGNMTIAFFAIGALAIINCAMGMMLSGAYREIEDKEQVILRLEDELFELEDQYAIANERFMRQYSFLLSEKGEGNEVSD